MIKDIEELEALDSTLITVEKLEEILELWFVDSFEDNGLSGSSDYYGKHWYTIYLTGSGDEIQLYTE